MLEVLGLVEEEPLRLTCGLCGLVWIAGEEIGPYCCPPCGRGEPLRFFRKGVDDADLRAILPS